MTTRENLEEVSSDFRRFCEGLTDAQMNWRPSAGAWCIAECLDHLTVSAAKFAPAIEVGIAKAPRPAKLGGGAGLRPPWWGRLFLKILEPPVRRFKAKAPPDFAPRPARKGAVVLADFIEAHATLLRKWPDWMQADLRRTQVRGVFPVTFPLVLVLEVIPTHMRRHLWQARQVASAPGFPR